MGGERETRFSRERQKSTGIRLSKRRRRPRFDLVVLDFDGTLVDSRAILVGLVNETLRANGYPHAPSGAIAALLGLPLGEVFRRALPGLQHSAIAALCEHYRSRADRPEFVRQFRLYDGVVETLAHLRGTGIRLVVCTSKMRATTIDIARHCAIDALLDDVIGDDCVSRGKPHPEMIERARLRSRTPAVRTLIVGDTTFDMEMGKAAGVATCAVTYGMHALALLRELKPDFVIDDFRSLIEVAAGRDVGNE